MVVWEVKLIKRVEQYISNMFYVGFRISCLNQDFQDFRIFRIRESYTPVAPLGLFVDGYPLTIHLSPLRGYSVHVTGCYGRGDLAPTRRKDNMGGETPPLR